MSNVVNAKEIWLYDLLRRRGRLRFDLIDAAWQESCLNERHTQLSERVFHKWKQKLKENLGVIIKCTSLQKEYYILNDVDLRKSAYATWMIDTMMVENTLSKAIGISDRILLQNVPSGRFILDDVIEAMKNNRKIELYYHRYECEKPYLCRLLPYWLKLFEQRWYVVGYSEDRGGMRIYCLDRVEEIKILNESFVYPENIDALEYFCDCYGIIRNVESAEVCDVRLYAKVRDACFLRDLPLHHTQKEYKVGDHYEFTMRVRPTFDYLQAIIKQGPGVHVMEPESLRVKVHSILKEMIAQYE